MVNTKLLKLAMLILVMGIMVTGYGGMCQKKDSGSSGGGGTGSPWTLANSGIGSGESIQGIYAPSSSVVWVTTNQGVYRSTDGGLTYTKKLSDTDQDQPIALDADTAWAMANFSIRKTTDGGANWTTQSIDSWPDKNYITAADANTLYCVGWEGAIWKTTNGGTTWTKVRTETMNEQFGMCKAASASVVYVGGMKGASSITGAPVIYKTTDGGSNWAQVYLGSSGAGWISGITLSDANNVWCSGTNGLIIKTTNGGTSWTTLTSGTAVNLGEIARAGSGLLVTAGAPGTILTSTDNGNTWVAETSGTTESVGNISIAGNTIWVGGANGVILKRNF